MIVHIWVSNNTRRSVLTVVVLHFMQNFTGELLELAVEARPIRLVLEVGLALGLIAWWSRRPSDGIDLSTNRLFRQRWTGR